MQIVTATATTASRGNRKGPRLSDKNDVVLMRLWVRGPDGVTTAGLQRAVEAAKTVFERVNIDPWSCEQAEQARTLAQDSGRPQALSLDEFERQHIAAEAWLEAYWMARRVFGTVNETVEGLDLRVTPAADSDPVDMPHYEFVARIKA